MGGRSDDTQPSTGTDRPEAVSLNHIAHTVPDIDAAVEWYRDVLGFEIATPPRTVRGGDGKLASRFADIVGEFTAVKMAHLRDGKGTGFELFEYESLSDEGDSGERRSEENWPHRPGINHFAVTCTDIESLVHRVLDNGGDQYTEIWEINPEIGHRVAYLLDPWDNVIEASSHSFENFSM